MNRQLAVYQSDFGYFMVGKANTDVVSHAHPESQISINLGPGNVTMEVSKNCYTLAPGEMVLLNPWVTHARHIEPDQHTFTAPLTIAPSWLERRKSSQTAGTSLFRHVHARLSSSQMNELISLTTVLSQPHRQSEDTLRKHLFSLIDSIIERNGRASSDELTVFRFDAIDRRIQRAFELIRTRAIGKVNVDDIARDIGMSRASFFRRFKNQYGISPLEAVNSFRMGWARRCLGTSEQQVGEISNQLGYSNPGHFTRFFQMHTGIAPSDYRRQLCQFG